MSDRSSPRAESIARPGRNCWRKVRADRVAFLVDAASYFDALAAAVERAQSSVFLMAWDVHSQVLLRRTDDGEGLSLGAALDRAARRHSRLRGYVLDWDFASVYALEREWRPLHQFRKRTHRRIRFRLDDAHPLGSSHHQKIAVCDDRIAFVGGIDVAQGRWDTREHRPVDRRRVRPDGAEYGPFHDVQMAIDGEAAAAVGELCRERWRRATGQSPKVRASDGGGDPWPPTLEPDVRDVEVALARTEPAYGGRPQVSEIERFYLDAIAAAQRSIYIENHDLTSAAVGAALSRRRAEKDGPGVVVVGPRRCMGWLEDATMGVLRARLLQQLARDDRHGRLRALAPVVGESQVDVMVHAKVFVVDDRAVRIGSSNLNNRSMGLDSECDVWLESEGRTDIEEAIAGFRDGLLAEHLGVDPSEVAEARGAQGSLVAAIDALAGRSDRTLVPIHGELDPVVDSLVPEGTAVDPEEPIAIDRIADEADWQLGVVGTPRSLMWRTGAVAAVVMVLAGVWRWTPASAWLAPDVVAAAVAPVVEAPYAPALALVAFTVASLLVVPVTLLTVLSGLVFGPWVGFFAAALGSMCSAAAAYACGRWLLRDVVERLAEDRFSRLDEHIGRAGLMSVVLLRLVPIAPYTIVNLLAGAANLRFRHFFWGTAIVMLPGALALTVFAETSRVYLRQPDAASAALVIVTGAAIAALAMFVQRRFLGRRRGSVSDSKSGGR